MVFNEKIDSESKFDSVAELLPGKENHHIKVICSLLLWNLLPCYGVAINLIIVNLQSRIVLGRKLIIIMYTVIVSPF
jgi:hypothetical protein